MITSCDAEQPPLGLFLVGLQRADGLDYRRSRGDSPADIAADKPRVVRWTEFPEPTNPRLPFLTQRKTIDIEDRRAEKILADNKFRFVDCGFPKLTVATTNGVTAASRIKSNLVEESYHWWLNSVEYVLARSFVLPWDADVAPMQQIPKLASAEPIAPFWILYVRASVKSAAPATIPEHVRKAQAHLVQVRAQLMGVFDFKAFDRRCHDTRIQERPA